jgi:hypothetical protein
MQMRCVRHEAEARYSPYGQCKARLAWMKERSAYVFVGLAGTVYVHRIFSSYMNVYLVIFLPRIPYINRIYMVLANPRVWLVHSTTGQRL